MNEGGEPTDPAEPIEPEAEDDHAYFQAIEEVFVQLRGSPLLLSPADWQVARRWHREGLPLDLVRRALEGVFEKRKERGTKGKISSLRYCAPAVEAAWNDLRELTAPGEREEAPSFDIPARLAALAAALPPGLPGGLPGGEGFAGRIRSLVELGGGGQAVEESLAALDLELLDAAGAALDDAARAEVEGAVTATLTSLGSRLPAAELARSRERLTRQILRQRLGLPVLSLFSPEAEG